MSDNLKKETETESQPSDDKKEEESAFLNIPVEIFLYICTFLDARFVADSLSLVCRRFNEILLDDSIWKSRIAKHFSGIYPALTVDNPDVFDWREACACIEDEINLWKFKDDVMSRIVLKDIHYASVDAVLLMNEGTLCFSGSRDHNLVAWDLQEYETSVRPKKIIENAHNGWIWNLASHKERLYSCSWDSTVKSWDVQEDLKEISVLLCEQPALALACNPTTVAVGLYNRRVMLFDPRVGANKLFSYKAHSGAVLAVAMVNGYIVSASEDKTIAVWDQRAGKIHKKKNLMDETSGSNAYPMCLSYTNNIIYVGDVKGHLHLMNPKRGEFNIEESYNVGHTGKMTSIHHDAGCVMTCSCDGTLRIMAPTRKLEPLTVLRSVGGEITNFDYKDHVLAMGTTECVVEVWFPKSALSKD